MMQLPAPLCALAIALTLGTAAGCADRGAAERAPLPDSAAPPTAAAASSLTVTPVSHASFVLSDGRVTVYNDPVGGADAYAGFAAPDLVLLSDIHGDHLDSATLVGVVAPTTTLVAPEAVAVQLPPKLRAQTRVLANGASATVAGIPVEAVPMYNLREEASQFHPKGRGNGYVIALGGERLYIAGDTEDIPEMRALEGIDRAFVPMNLPYTMPVDAAASAVADFSPRVVYPYHYRGKGGLSDTAQFRALLAESNPAVQVVGLDWYPDRN